jgi:hypothetical protein
VRNLDFLGDEMVECIDCNSLRANISVETKGRLLKTADISQMPSPPDSDPEAASYSTFDLQPPIAPSHANDAKAASASSSVTPIIVSRPGS